MNRNAARPEPTRVCAAPGDAFTLADAGSSFGGRNAGTTSAPPPPATKPVPRRTSPAKPAVPDEGLPFTPPPAEPVSPEAPAGPKPGERRIKVRPGCEGPQFF